ncbi:IclR family transcriptional regulator [Microbaculum marinum]|uniref:IclR family transcriptional regulator n=1 Tax=Microbaculum marinum TaxID=1764581 RepID=A0AAW9S372_9HYPH
MAESPIHKATNLLRILVEASAPLSLSELVAKSGYNTSTTLRLMRMLAEDGFVAFAPAGKLYTAGAEFLRLAAISLNDNPFFLRLRPALAALARETGETVVFNLYDREAGLMIIVMSERSPQPLGYDIPLGRRDFLHTGASGKSILAFLPEQEIHDVIERHGLVAVTPDTVTDRDVLFEQLLEIRQNGIAISRGERVEGAVGSAAPVYGEDGRVAGSILVTVPAFRHTEESQKKVTAAVKKAADNLRAGGVRKEHSA